MGTKGFMSSILIDDNWGKIVSIIERELHMTDQEAIEAFDQFSNWTCKDIENGIKGQANYLVALGLVSYTEFLGGLFTGNAGITDEAKNNFTEAIKNFPAEYTEVDRKIVLEDGPRPTIKGIYSAVRCGLVHEYGIKGTAGVLNNPDGFCAEHIGIKIGLFGGKNGIIFSTNEFFRDYQQVLKNVAEKLNRKDQSLLDNMRTAFTRLAARQLKA